MAWRLTPHRRIATAALTLWLAVAALLLSRGVAQPPVRGVTAPRVAPVGAGVTREVRSPADWDAAVGAAAPGDVIRIKAAIGQRLVYRGRHEGTGAGTAADGAEAAPIVITADPDVWIDPGDQASDQGALDVIAADHVHVVGVNVRNAQFGIRCLQCVGSPGHPVRLADNRVTLIGHAGIHVGGHWATHAPSTWALVENNVISRTGQLEARHGEGIYLGYGGTEWADTTAEVTVRGNDISFTGAEGVDVKPGTRDIVVEGNLIHDLAPIDGGAISAHYVNAVPDPHPDQLDPVLIRANRIWNQNLAGVSGANDWAIWVGHGGVDVVDNLIWGLRGDATLARAVRIRSTQPFGPQPIRIQDNLFWTARGWVAEGSPSGASNVSASGNLGVDPASADVPVSAASFIGPVPSVGASGTADDGGGPGSAFVLAPSATSTTTAPSSTSSTTAAPSSTTGATEATTSTVFDGGSDIATSQGAPRTNLPVAGAATAHPASATAGPVAAARPGQSSRPGQPGQPSQPSQPSQPDQPGQSGQSGAPGPSDGPAPPADPDPTAPGLPSDPPPGGQADPGPVSEVDDRPDVVAFDPAPGAPGWPRRAGQAAVLGLGGAAAELTRRALRRPVRRS